MTKLSFGKYSVETSNSNKILLPPGITKLDIINYYNKIGSIMIPFIKSRPLMMQRMPDGIWGDSFYQKNRSRYFPDWIKSVKIKTQNTVTDFVLCQNKATLVYLANQGCLTFHVWLSKYPNFIYPDKIVFDLDPGAAGFSEVIEAALLIKKLVEKENLNPYVMTTGSRGAHLVIPLKKKVTFDFTKKFAKSIGEQLATRFPTKFTIELNKEKRADRLFIDYLRNQLGATSVAPYSIRAYNNGPIATPLSWGEFLSLGLNSQTYNISNIFDKLNKSLE